MKIRSVMDTMPCNKQGGFAIVEAMVATAIFAISMAAIAVMLNTATSSNRSAEGITNQSGLAADLIETLEKLDWADSEWDPGAHAPVAVGKYTISHVVQQDTLLNRTKRVTVTVTWLHRGETKTINVDHVKPNTT